MRCLRTLSLMALVASISLAAQAQEKEKEKKSSHAGYVSADWSKSLTDKPPSIQVMLDPPLLKLVASASKQSDEDLNALISQLAFVRVNVYEDLSTEDAKLAEAVDTQVTTLAGKGWSTVARVRQDDQHVDVLMKTVDDKIVGFVVFVAGDGDLVFVNIAGDIDPENFGEKLGTVVSKVSGGELNIEDMPGVLDSIKNSSGTDKEDEEAKSSTDKEDDKARSSTESKDD
jgi:hypothetical protein